MLNSRKRVLIALVHTVVFLGLAIYTALLTVRSLGEDSPVSAWIITGVYLLVSGALLLLATLSRTVLERLYFALCTTSAAMGLCRQVAGDARLWAAAPIRVVLLAGAVITGITMLRASTGRR